VSLLVKALGALHAATSDNFLDLVKATNLRPDVDFVGANLTDMDFRNLDLTGFNFYAADFRGSDLKGAWLRTDRCAGARFGDSLPHFIEPEISKHPHQAWLPLHDNSADNFVFYSVGHYMANRLAFDRMAFVLQLTQDAPTILEIQRFASIAVLRERSRWCRKVLSFLVDDDLTDVPRGLLVARTLDQAVRAVHTLRRHELIAAIGRHMAPTRELITFLSELRKRTRSGKNIWAIDRILENVTPSES
jgi:uncharacterized protein YjbI with pentapeptide repeats